MGKESDKTVKDVTIEEQFKDLPMQNLIGGPLVAAAKAHAAFAGHTTTELKDEIVENGEQEAGENNPAEN